MKTFYSAQEIEELAAQGRTELVIDESAVLTDLARHAAQQLGIKIVSRGRPEAPAAAAPVVAGLARSNPIRPGSKPRGCQHGPQAPSSAGAAISAAGSSSNPGTVVDQLVGLVKRLGNNKSGSS